MMGLGDDEQHSRALLNFDDQLNLNYFFLFHFNWWNSTRKESVRSWSWWTKLPPKLTLTNIPFVPQKVFLPLFNRRHAIFFLGFKYEYKLLRFSQKDVKWLGVVDWKARLNTADVLVGVHRRLAACHPGSFLHLFVIKERRKEKKKNVKLG